MPGPSAEPGSEPLLRRLTVLGVWALAINGTIGAGIFGTPGAAAASTGIYSPLVFLLCGLLMVPIVLSFAEVASGFTGTGGPVLYAETAFGPFTGFQVGWTYYVARLSSSAANVSLMVATLGWFWPGAGHGALRVGLLLAICGALVWVNVIGTRQAMWSLGGLTLLKLVPLLALVVFGLGRLDAAAFPFASTPPPSVGALGGAVMLLVYAFVGWESALIPAGETRDPARDMPRALLWALGTATLLYVLIQAVSVAALPDLAHATGRPLVAVGEALLGPAGAVLLTLGIVVSVGGNVFSATLSTPRITYALSRAGLLPRAFGRVHAAYRTPAVSIVVYGAAVFALAASGSFVELARISVLTRLLIYLAVIAALPRLRRRAAPGAGPGGPPARAWRLPGGYVIPGAAALVCVALLVQVSWDSVWHTAIYLAVGSALYALARRGGAGRAS
jgi:amino acid transporter